MTQHTNLPFNDFSLGEPDEVTTPKSERYLESAYPVWLVTPLGHIIGANLLAQWLWKTPKTSNLFGFTAFDIFNRNRERIPKDKNNEFFRKKIPVLKRFSRDNRKLYESFLEYVENDPDLRKIYDEAKYIPDEKWESKRVWEYPLIIDPPAESSTDERLKFQVTIYRLVPNNEFLGVYKPDSSSDITKTIVRQKYEQAMAVKDMIEYVQYERREDRGEEVMNKEHMSQAPMPDATRRVLAALKNPAYDWRTIGGIARETELLPEAVSETLENLSDQIVRTQRRREGTIFTTREHYQKTEPLFNRVLSVLAGRVK